MVLGVCFIGGVHDYFSTMLSTRDRGKSIGQLVNERISKRAGVATSALMAFGGILVYGIFLYTVSGTLESIPTAVIPTVGLIPIAVLYGIMVRKGVKVLLATLIGFSLTIVGIFLGLNYPIQATRTFWIWAFAIYTFFASYVPVWVLLQPRDYLSTIGLLTSAMIIALIGYEGFPGAIANPGGTFSVAIFNSPH